MLNAADKCTNVTVATSALFLMVNCRWTHMYVTAVCRSGYYQLRQLRPIARSLSVEAAIKSRRLYRFTWTIATQYCTACLTGWRDATTSRLHHTDTATASLATSTTTSRPPSRFSSAWLVMQAPGYLAEELSARRQRSPTSISRYNDLRQSRAARPTSSATDVSQLPVHRPRLWNSLPIKLRQCHSLEQFKRLLKTFLFSVWGNGALWNCLKVRRIYLLTYLFNVKCVVCVQI